MSANSLVQLITSETVDPNLSITDPIYDGCQAYSSNASILNSSLIRIQVSANTSITSELLIYAYMFSREFECNELLVIFIKYVVVGFSIASDELWSKLSDIMVYSCLIIANYMRFFFNMLCSVQELIFVLYCFVVNYLNQLSLMLKIDRLTIYIFHSFLKCHVIYVLQLFLIFFNLNLTFL